MKNKIKTKDVTKEFECGMWPIMYKDKLWNKWDCHKMFLCLYSCKEALNYDRSCYISEGMFVYPDGSISHK